MMCCGFIVWSWNDSIASIVAYINVCSRAELLSHLPKQKCQVHTVNALFMHYLSLTRNIIFQNVDRWFLEQQTKKRLSACRIQQWGFRFCLLVLWRLGFSMGGSIPIRPHRVRVLVTEFLMPFRIADIVATHFGKTCLMKILFLGGLFLMSLSFAHLTQFIAESCWKLKLSHPKSP